MKKRRDKRSWNSLILEQAREVDVGDFGRSFWDWGAFVDLQLIIHNNVPFFGFLEWKRDLDEECFDEGWF